VRAGCAGGGGCATLAWASGGCDATHQLFLRWCSRDGGLVRGAGAGAGRGVRRDVLRRGVPGPMPVDQSGENVIFVIGDTESEVHIQISIDPNTNAENFGWLVPLTAVPEFSVGSQPLFDQIRAASVPQYDITTTFENCGGDSRRGQRQRGIQRRQRAPGTRRSATRPATARPDGAAGGGGGGVPGGGAAGHGGGADQDVAGGQRVPVGRERGADPDAVPGGGERDRGAEAAADGTTINDVHPITLRIRRARRASRCG
jgi:hypothetical protein